MNNIKSSIRQFFLGMSVKDFLEIGLILLGLGFLAATTFGWLPVWQTLLGTIATLVGYCLVQFNAEGKILSLKIQ